MLKNTIATLLATLGLYVSVQGAQEAIDIITPDAARVVSDANLRTAYTEAYRLHMLEDIPFEQAFRTTVPNLQTPELRYTVDGLTVTAETDWSCRRLVIEDVWVRISDC